MMNGIEFQREFNAIISELTGGYATMVFLEEMGPTQLDQLITQFMYIDKIQTLESLDIELFLEDVTPISIRDYLEWFEKSVLEDN